jgi:MFS family permease
LIDRRVVLVVGTSQLVMWGISYYLIGIFGPAMERDLGWPAPWIYGGFSAALFVMGVVSPWAGRAVDRHGGTRIMALGCVLVALACIGLSATGSLPTYFASWLLMGVAMRMTLYDAAFASLARRAGMGSRRAMSQVTLFGGLASTVFWPFGNVLESSLGWRHAVLVYAAIALSMAALLVSLPKEPGLASAANDSPAPDAGFEAGRELPRARRLCAVLYAVITALVAFLNSGMSSHMIAMLMGLGLGTASAVAASTARGPGQVAGRLGELLLAARVHPARVNLVAAALMPVSFAFLVVGGTDLSKALVFAALYGLGNGIATITRGSLPLVLFGARGYGTLVGRLLVPSFLLSAAAPIVYAEATSIGGSSATIGLSIAVAALALAASIALEWLGRPLRGGAG